MSSLKKLVVLSGSGISAESGIPTFRASDGLWEDHRIEDVAAPEGWEANPGLVLNFYNERRRKLTKVKPNAGHLILADLQKHFEVQIITQNVDDLHERAGSENVLHLHGELTKARSTKDERLVYDIAYKDISLGDKCDKGSQLRPHIVWFGEAVPLIEEAANLVSEADIFLVVGTSLKVYPAAGLSAYLPSACPIYVIDPGLDPSVLNRNMGKVEMLRMPATEGMKILAGRLLE